MVLKRLDSSGVKSMRTVGEDVFDVKVWWLSFLSDEVLKNGIFDGQPHFPADTQQDSYVVIRLLSSAPTLTTERTCILLISTP